MKWEGHRQSDRVDDLRTGSSGRPRRVGNGGLSLGGIVIAFVAAWLFGINPMTVLGLLGEGAPPQHAPAAPGPLTQDDATRFTATVLADTEDVWNAYFQRTGQPYEAPRLTLFREATPTECGQGDAAMGPFYCPADQRIYLDLGFFDTLRTQLGAPGDFAQAYVIAHEVGHHIQQQLGISAQVQRTRQRADTRRSNELSVRLELQADCFAGVWAHHSQNGKGWLDATDVNEALNAASRIGDDTLQRQSQGRVVPESFTHGSAAQRQRWFQTGLSAGRLEACDTFGTRAV
jgi:hypothetical protein